MPRPIPLDDDRLQRACRDLACPHCHAGRASGVVLHRAHWTTRGTVEVRVACLACGYPAAWVVAIDPDPAPVPLRGDELLDVHEALKGDWWEAAKG